MFADVAPPGHYYLCIHHCSHWNNSRAPAAPVAALWGGSIRAAPLLRSFSYSIGRPAERMAASLASLCWDGGFKGKPTSMGDHCEPNYIINED